jgi:hypothetical protein
MCGNRYFRCSHLIAITMIGSDDKFVIIFVAERNDISYDAIKFFDGGNHLIHLSRMPHHISVCKIGYDEIEVFGLHDELVADLLCGHLRIQIIGRHFV